MIVRIATEGQYEVGEDALVDLNRLDNEAVAACAAADRERFATAFAALLELVRTRGRRLDHEELAQSELILPPPDVSMEEATADFSGEGLIPG